MWCYKPRRGGGLKEWAVIEPPDPIYTYLPLIYTHTPHTYPPPQCSPPANNKLSPITAAPLLDSFRF